MQAVLLMGHGGPEMLALRTDVPTPTPTYSQVLVRVGAAGLNNTDVNTRLGWYSKSVTGATDEATTSADVRDAAWDGSALELPRIQGADVAGEVVAVGADVSPARIGERVVIRSMQEVPGEPSRCRTLGSEMDGGFAQFCAAESDEVFPISSHLSDVELASFPCAYSTAETMLDKAGVAEGERVLITGASGGVGSAAIQLSHRRGAIVTAVASESKWPQLEPLGPDTIVDRSTDLIEAFGAEAFDVVVDVVAGPSWPSLLTVLRNQGRYVASGAIAGPLVELDVRTLYLKDLTLFGSTLQRRVVFENLVSYIERGEIASLVARTFPLAEFHAAQELFLTKDFVGKLVVVP